MSRGGRFALRMLLVLIAFAVLLLGIVHWLNFRDESAIADSPTPIVPTADQVTRGAYLARAGNCIACHTARGGLAYAGGRAIETPFGRVFAGNITPDRETGIGAWSEAEFRRAMHNGRSKDGHFLLPAFPYPNFTQVTRADADAIYAYLLGMTPVRQVATPHELGFPYNLQLSLAVWRALYFKPGIYKPSPSQSAEWNRGGYLVRGLGHCIACHSSRNALGATTGNLELSGGLIPMQHWYAPSLVSTSEAGVANWQTQQVVDLLKTGVSPTSAVIGPMAEVVFRSTQYLSDADLRSMAVFLQALPQSDPVAKSSEQLREESARIDVSSLALGHTVYKDHCASCHGDQGEGAAHAYPPLAGNRAVTLASPVNVIRTILSGGFAPSTAGNPRPYGMPPFSPSLNDAEVAAVATYIRRSWGNAASQVQPLEVLHSR